MYLPYLRGKQFELIGLREFSSIPIDPAKISPILEPVKDINSVFVTSIRSCLAAGSNINFILNPKVGALNLGNTAQLVDFYNSVEGNNHLVPAFIIQNPADLQYAAATLAGLGKGGDRYTLIHKSRISEDSLLVDFLREFPNVKFNVIDGSCGQRYSRFFPRESIVKLSDPFISETKNAGYLSRDSQVFSEEHLYFKEEGDAGFSDYLTIGEEFTEGGFLPYAVAIHLTYQHQVDKKVWIAHFVSDSNDDYSDPAGKFGEALQKLIDFADEQALNTYAVRAFRKIYDGNTYPGLGVIKKLSILNHIELTQSLL